MKFQKVHDSAISQNTHDIRLLNVFQGWSVYISERIAIFALVTQQSMKLIELNLQRIIDLCRKHKVKTLAVFGSILTDRFNDQSDVDLLVNFDTTDHEKWDYVTNYFDFQEALEKIFGRKVDLVVEKGLKNKYFIANVNRTKQVIYG